LVDIFDTKNLIQAGILLVSGICFIVFVGYSPSQSAMERGIGLVAGLAGAGGILITAYLNLRYKVVESLETAVKDTLSSDEIVAKWTEAFRVQLTNHLTEVMQRSLTAPIVKAIEDSKTLQVETMRNSEITTLAVLLCTSPKTTGKKYEKLLPDLKEKKELAKSLIKALEEKGSP